MELVVATNNAGKLQEIQALLPAFQLLTLRDIGYTAAIPEPYHTFEQNALTKASTIYDFCDKMVMADDSGLCVEALHGAPGVISAHYAGLPVNDPENVQKVLTELQHEASRKAYYIAVICLITEGGSYFFEGYCHGTIAHEPRGEGGFGYDPIFIPQGYDQTFAELPLPVKNTLSHRGIAVRKMVDFLSTINR